MFKFDFKIEEDDQNIEDSLNKEEIDETSLKSSNTENSNIIETLAKCDEIPLKHQSDDESRELTNFSSNDYEIWYPKGVECQATETSHSDLLSGVYEGGLKIWECTQDLADFLTKTNENGKSLLTHFEGKHVLDLGCGVGVLGVLALIHNAKGVSFQDYNKEVIETTTISTILSNKSIYDEIDLDKVALFSGDWDNFVDFMRNHHSDIKYDFIITSETIYNVKYYDKLMNVFRELLNDDGMVFLAAKTIYFGVGGGLRSFEKALNDSGDFLSQVVWKSETGVVREILKIHKKKRKNDG